MSNRGRARPDVPNKQQQRVLYSMENRPHTPLPKKQTTTATTDTPHQDFSQPTEEKPDEKPSSKYFNEILLRMTVLLILGLAFLYYPKTTPINSKPSTLSPRSTVDQHISTEKVEQPRNVEIQWPTVSIGLLIRNKQHTLPYFLHHLEKLDYPKGRMELLIYADFCTDNSMEVIERWLSVKQHLYHRVQMEHDETSVNVSALGNHYWTAKHFKHLLELKQSLLDTARYSWAEYFFSIDVDVILTEPQTLKQLVAVSELSTEEQPISIIAPLLNCTNSDTYSNFWGAMQANGYYQRSKDYFDILRRDKLGIFPVALVHSVYLINLRHMSTKYLKFYPIAEGYKGPIDDVIVFARHVQSLNVTFHVDNRELYGFFYSPVNDHDLRAFVKLGSYFEKWEARDKELFQHMKLQVMVDTEGRVEITKDELIFPDPDIQLESFGFDKIFVVNLERRVTRLKLMQYCLKHLGIEWQLFQAVDGKKLNDSLLNSWGIKQMDGYYDPYHNRSLKYGEIGCFLSHYQIWQEMIEKGYQSVLIFEDDVRFSAGFMRSMRKALEEANTHVPGWDLMYLGRKRMSKNEKTVANTTLLAWPDYTYWTLAYVLNRRGAEKLVRQKPLDRIVAVDEYIPIMFDRHPNKEWLAKFGPRNLVAISTEPLLVEPCHYTGQPLYQSDTEDSVVIEKLVPKTTSAN
ncbi:hypothetical protein Ciccas_009399 [Cichlidogyrus casuarinus]|uniref:Glycosyl transferase family 25 domain-containing protein n=1 Tax=Cichlidogyrus casuarinus TaxID=1844966 RepID=A0ABD2PY37_9PLAT